jgi:hypothetical protein
MRTINANGFQIVIQVLEWVDQSNGAVPTTNAATNLAVRPANEAVPTTSAHTNPAVQQVWAELATAAEFVPFGQLSQSPLSGVIFTVVRPTPGNENAVKNLLIQQAQTIRGLGLAAQNSILTLQSDVDGTFLQMIELANPGTENQITGNPDIQGIRAQFNQLGQMLDVSALPEGGCSFASLALLSEN